MPWVLDSLSEPELDLVANQGQGHIDFLALCAAWPCMRPPMNSYSWQLTVPKGLRLVYRP